MTVSIKNTTAILLTTLALLTVLAYFGSLHNGFVWDDNDIIVNNRVNRDIGNIATIFRSADTVFADEPGAYYRPINRLTYLMDYQVYGLKPFGYHVENLLLHILTLFALFFMTLRVSGSRVTAYVASLLCALHPINVEAVNFISGGRNTILATLFTIATFLVWERWRAGESDRICWQAGALFFLGILSKEPAFMLFPFLVIREITTVNSRGQWGRVGRIFVPFVIASGIYLAVRTIVLSGVIAGTPTPIGAWQRLMQLVYIIPNYLLNILLPVRLCSNYHVPLHFQDRLPLLIAVCGLLVLVVVLLLKSGRPTTRFGLLWLAINFIPIAHIVPIPSAPMADRYLYLPVIGIWLILADGASALFDRPRVRVWLTVTALFVFAALGMLSWQYSRTWRDDVSLNFRILQVEPNSVFALYNLGGAYKTRGELDKAAVIWQRVIELAPSHSRALNQLGIYYLLKGAAPQALDYLNRAIAANPRNAVVHYNRGIVFEAFGRPADAVEAYREFLSIVPPEHINLVPMIQAKITTLSRLPRKELP